MSVPIHNQHRVLYDDAFVSTLPPWNGGGARNRWVVAITQRPDPWMQRLRARAEEWYRATGSTDEDIRTRLRGYDDDQLESTLNELAIFGALSAMECRPVFHPAVQEQTPDLSIPLPGGKDALVEVITRGPAFDLERAEKRMNIFRVGVSADFPVSFTHFEWIPDEIDEPGIIRMAKELRGALGEQLVGVNVDMEPFGVRGIATRLDTTWPTLAAGPGDNPDDPALIRRAVASKATGKLYAWLDTNPLPYIVVVCRGHRLTADVDDVRCALYGDENIRVESVDGYVTFDIFRRKHGIFGHEKRPMCTRISAVIYFHRHDEDDHTAATMCVMHNPWARTPLAAGTFGPSVPELILRNDMRSPAMRWTADPKIKIVF